MVIETSKSSMAHGQTFLLMIILSSTYIVQDQLQDAEIKKEDLDKIALQNYISEATLKIINSSEIWNSLVSSIFLVEGFKRIDKVITHSKEALNLQNELKSNSKFKKLFHLFLKNAVFANITFLGWDLGGSLYKMAQDSLEADKDYNDAAKFSNLISNPKLLKKIYSRIFAILLNNDDLRDLWFWNVFRHKIATGEFATLVSSMATATTLGSTLFPGGGTILGFVFGLVGGGIYLAIPQDTKDNITYFFQKLRRNFWLSGESGDNWFQYSNTLESVIRISADALNNNKVFPPMLRFPKQKESMDNIISSYFEEFFILESKLQLAQDKLILARQSSNTTYIEFYRNQISQLEAKYLKSLNQLDKYIEFKSREMTSLVNKYNLDLISFSHIPIVSEIQEYQTSLLMQQNLLNELTTQIKESMLLAGSEKTYYPFLFEIYFYGYDQEYILKTIRN